MKRLLASWLLVTLLPAAHAADEYFVSFDEALDHVQVKACFDGAAPRRLYRHSQSAAHTSWIRREEKPLRVDRGRRSIGLPDLPPDACIEWRVRLREAARRMDRGVGYEIDGDLVVETSLWFWKGGRERDVRVKVDLPSGAAFSTPWPAAGDRDDGDWYRPDPTLSSWTSRTAVGRFPAEVIEVPGARVRLAAVGDLDPDQRRKISAWIAEAARAVSSVYGHFPRPRPQVLVVPIGRRSEAVPWAHVIRGGGLAIELFIDETRPLGEFNRDWTAIHEFSHLLLPHVSSRDRWLSEGLASYYQHVLRARNGVLTEQQAWQKLHDGFRRGARGAGGGTLADATRSGWRSTMRVYWSGAALMLMADTRLRARTGGEQSLDSALARLGDCCLANGRTWRARDLMTRLDRLTGTQVFTTLYREHVHDEDFPDISDTWEELGLRTRFDRVTLDAQAPLSEVRAAIMSG